MLNKEKQYDLIKFEDGEFSLDVNVSPKEDTVWLNANQMAELFNIQRPAIIKHISNIISSRELDFSTCSILEQVQMEGDRIIKRKIKIYNLDMIISVGYRVNSKRGILFRKWATSILKQYMLIGYSINEKRCLECQENLISLNNKVDYLYNQNQSTLERLTNLENIDTILRDKLFYEEQIFDAYSYIKLLFLSAKVSITNVDGYVDIPVLNMLNSIFLPITIYTFPSASLCNQDITTFNMNHHFTVVKTSKIHDRFILIDDTIYLCGSSIKDVGKKRFIMTKIDFVTTKELIKNL